MLQYARGLTAKLAVASLLASMTTPNAGALADDASATDSAAATQISAKDRRDETLSPASRIESSLSKSKECSALLADLVQQRLSDWLYRSYMISSPQRAVPRQADYALVARTELYCNDII
jgi:hypothetical protein